MGVQKADHLETRSETKFLPGSLLLVLVEKNSTPDDFSVQNESSDSALKVRLSLLLDKGPGRFNLKRFRFHVHFLQAHAASETT
jgi:hypothetical protein